MKIDSTIVIKQEDMPVRKKQPPPAKAIADPKAYRRHPKHKKHEDTTRNERAPDGDNPPGASSFVSHRPA